MMYQWIVQGGRLVTSLGRVGFVGLLVLDRDEDVDIRSLFQLVYPTLSTLALTRVSAVQTPWIFDRRPELKIPGMPQIQYISRYRNWL